MDRLAGLSDCLVNLHPVLHDLLVELFDLLVRQTFRMQGDGKVEARILRQRLSVIARLDVDLADNLADSPAVMTCYVTNVTILVLWKHHHSANAAADSRHRKQSGPIKIVGLRKANTLDSSLVMLANMLLQPEKIITE